VRATVPAALIIATACGSAGAAGPGCLPAGGPFPFPQELSESSGAAWSVRHPGVIWTTGDGRVRTLFAVDTLGTVVAELPIQLPGVWDIEDLSVAPCEGGSCIYFADVGDNGLSRDTLLIHRMAEPALDESGPLLAEPLRVRLPDGPDDIEAMFIGPDGLIRLVSKGNGRPPALYRVPSDVGPDATREAALVQRLDSTSRYLGRQITGGSAVPGTKLVLLRTYEDLSVWTLVGERLEPVEGGALPLRTLREPQGEAIAAGLGGRVALTSEAGPLGNLGGMHLLRCTGLGNRPDPLS